MTMFSEDWRSENKIDLIHISYTMRDMEYSIIE